MLRLHEVAAVMLAVATIVCAVAYEYGRQDGYIVGWNRGFDAAETKAKD